MHSKAGVFWVLALIAISQVSADLGDQNLNTTQLLEKYKYAYEVHTVTTSDGYELIMHRILSRTNATNPKVVFMNHGLLMSSYGWVAMGPQNSIGYLLADAGHDVWMTNNRGNGVSMGASSGAALDNFWGFTMDDVGTNDTSAAIDYVLQQTNQADLTYIGHSQGCAILPILLLTKPEYEAKINKFIALAPLFSMKYSSTPEIVNEAFITITTTINKDCNIGEILATPFNTCIGPVCQVLYLTVHGFTPFETNLPTIKMVTKYYPAGGSTKNFVQFRQFCNNNDIAKYDYGTKGNLAHYGTSTPPIYDLRRLGQTPKYVFYGSLDNVISPFAVEDALPKLQNVQQKYKVPYAHNDFVFGLSVRTTVNNRILAIMRL